MLTDSEKGSRENKICLFLSQACTVETTGAIGECKFMSDCPVVLMDYQKSKKMPTLCDRKYRTVCCPMKAATTTTTTTQAPRRISERSKTSSEVNDGVNDTQIVCRVPRIRKPHLRDGKHNKSDSWWVQMSFRFPFTKWITLRRADHHEEGKYLRAHSNRAHRWRNCCKRAGISSHGADWLQKWKLRRWEILNLHELKAYMESFLLRLSVWRLTDIWPMGALSSSL